MPQTAQQTAQQLKGDIDAGRTGDKIPENGIDPGLATLGTDDEAAGTPNTPEQVALARALETRAAPPPPPEQSADGSKRPGPAVWMILGAFVAAVLVIAAAVWIGRS